MDIKYGLYDADGDAIAGSSDLKVKIKRDADDYFFDFDDTTFKADSHTTIDSAMSEIDGTNAPGEYELAVATASWDDGIYTIYCNYSGSPKQNGSDQVVITGGVEYEIMMQRLYQYFMYKRKVVDATGASAVRNSDDDGDLATFTVTDDSTDTVKTKLSWS